jgi:glycosyltransferase involved in cell wall biosynthesis
MDNWPKISVITPSYNQAQFIEATILSVLDQGYPNLEYIVIDGGSTDGSVEIIQKYADRLTYWVSEKDRGQSHAINKGFLKATGQIICWLNSDDTFMPGTLNTVADHLADGQGVYALLGHCYVVYSDGRPTLLLQGRYENRVRLLQYWNEYQMHQPAIFWRREVYEKIGLLDEKMHFIMDFDYWARIASHFDFKNLDVPLASANYHAEAKTGDNYAQYHKDLQKYNRRYWGSPLRGDYWKMFFSELWHLRFRPSARLLKRSMKHILGRPQAGTL